MLWFLAAGRLMGSSVSGSPAFTPKIVNGLYLFSIKGLLSPPAGITRVAPNFHADLKNLVCTYLNNMPVFQTDTPLPTGNMPVVNFLYIKATGGNVTVKAGAGGQVVGTVGPGQDAFMRFTGLAAPAIVGTAGATVEYCLYPP